MDELGKDERKEFEKERERYTQTRAEVKEFKKLYKERARTIRQKKVADELAVAAKAKPKAKSRQKTSQNQRTCTEESYWEAVYKNVQKYLPTSAITQPELAKICPPGGSIWNNWKHANWQGHFPPHPRFGVDWSDGGHTESGYECIRVLWKQYFEKVGVGIESCPVVGLFPLLQTPPRCMTVSNDFG